MQRELGAEVTFVDLSPRMVELARARGVAAREADVQLLPFADGSFDTVVAAWMLYHVPDLDAGLAEIARVLVQGGALIAVTNSVDHIAELRELLAYPPGAFELSFSSENGEELLGRHFSRIERFDAEVAVTVRERETLVAYRDSVSVPAGPVPEDVQLPFVVHGRSTIFVATT
jgi:SAM-dependent methyltransferase